MIIEKHLYMGLINMMQIDARIEEGSQSKYFAYLEKFYRKVNYVQAISVIPSDILTIR